MTITDLSAQAGNDPRAPLSVAHAVNSYVPGADASMRGIREALACLTCPVVELHRSNSHTRNPFPHVSGFAEIVRGQICGWGLALTAQGTAVALSRGA